MILFQEDWKKYPTAIVDIHTTNDSFKRIAAIYREMGIKNHAFPLALINPELQGVDPHSLNLTQEQIMMITIEAKTNPWYYFREIARAPGIGTPIPSKYRAHRGNIALYWLFFNHITVILEQIRQTGKSFGADSLSIYLMNLGVNNTQINLITKDETLRSFNLARLKEIQDTLPYYLNLKTRADLSNTETLTIRRLDNVYMSHLPNKSPKAALAVGRGLTSPIFHIDEAAFIYNIEITLPAALAAGTAARDIARAAGRHYGTILTTTAGKKDDRDGKYIYTLINESAIFTESLFDCANTEELELIIRKNSSQRENSRGKGVLRAYVSYDHTKLGYSDEWLFRQLEESMVTGDAADRDFFNRWTSGSQQSPLSIAIAEIIRKSEAKTYYTEISKPHGYVLRWYLPEDQIENVMRQGKFIMAIDTSDAVGGDDIGVIIRNVITGAVVAAGNFNETNLITFSEWVVNVLDRFQNLTAILERRSSGAMVIDYLLVMLPMRNMDPFKRLYNRIVQEALEDKDRFRDICRPLYARDTEFYTKYKKAFGFATSAVGATSRTDLYGSTLLNSAKYTGTVVKDKKLIDQLLGLVIKNGRVDHEDGEHDDLVIGWLLSYWLMTHGKNLEHYGISGSLVLSKCEAKVQEINSGDVYDRHYQEDLKNQIDELIETLKAEKDEYISRKYENRLRNMVNDYKQYDNTVMSVDELLKQISQDKAIRFRHQQYLY